LGQNSGYAYPAFSSNSLQLAARDVIPCPGRAGLQGEFIRGGKMKQNRESKIGNQRERIITVASRIMSQKGYKGASLQEISELVGIHKTTIFHYFKNKEELLLAVLRIAIENVTTQLERITDDKTLSPEEKLKKAIFTHLDSMVKHLDNVNVYHSEIRFLSNKNRRKYLDTRKYYASCFGKIIKEIKESNDRYFKGLDTKIVNFGILGMCNWVAKWYKESGSFKVEEIADIFYKMIMEKGNP
jgi:AcrR family transcriptional regulator